MSYLRGYQELKRRPYKVASPFTLRSSALQQAYHAGTRADRDSDVEGVLKRQEGYEDSLRAAFYVGRRTHFGPAHPDSQRLYACLIQQHLVSALTYDAAVRTFPLIDFLSLFSRIEVNGALAVARAAYVLNHSGEGRVFLPTVIEDLCGKLDLLYQRSEHEGGLCFQIKGTVRSTGTFFSRERAEWKQDPYLSQFLVGVEEFRRSRAVEGGKERWSSVLLTVGQAAHQESVRVQKCHDIQEGIQKMLESFFPRSQYDRRSA